MRLIGLVNHGRGVLIEVGGDSVANIQVIKQLEDLDVVEVTLNDKTRRPYTKKPKPDAEQQATDLTH